MKNKNISDFVAASMDAVLNSDQHKSLFNTQYKFASDQNDARAKAKKDCCKECGCELVKGECKECDSSSAWDDSDVGYAKHGKKCYECGKDQDNCYCMPADDEVYLFDDVKIPEDKISGVVPPLTTITIPQQKDLNAYLSMHSELKAQLGVPETSQKVLVEDGIMGPKTQQVLDVIKASLGVNSEQKALEMVSREVGKTEIGEMKKKLMEASKTAASFNIAIDSLLTASAALDAVGMSNGSALSLKLASLVVEAKKKMSPEEKKKLMERLQKGKKGKKPAGSASSKSSGSTSSRSSGSSSTSSKSSGPSSKMSAKSKVKTATTKMHSLEEMNQSLSDMVDEVEALKAQLEPHDFNKKEAVLDLLDSVKEDLPNEDVIFENLVSGLGAVVYLLKENLHLTNSFMKNKLISRAERLKESLQNLLDLQEHNPERELVDVEHISPEDLDIDYRSERELFEE